jgi:hypothetical protein
LFASTPDYHVIPPFGQAVCGAELTTESEIFKFGLLKLLPPHPDKKTKAKKPTHEATFL